MDVQKEVDKYRTKVQKERDKFVERLAAFTHRKKKVIDKVDTCIEELEFQKSKEVEELTEANKALDEVIHAPTN